MNSIKILLVLEIIFVSNLFSQDKVQLNTNVDLVSRYIWRGIDVASTPSVQPSLGLAYSNFMVGLWGAYTLSNQTSSSDEIDIWISYNLKVGEFIISPLITDYYYPNSGKRLFDFNEGKGAHLLEAGLKLSKEAFPIIVSGYYNFYNEPGNNTYFEISYTANVNEFKVDSFIGAAGGSKSNSLFYNTENFNVINIGMKITKPLFVTGKFTIPVFASVIFNPRNEIANVIAGITL
ncbi:MAG: hypothetical protein IPM56_02270 [Ignavibacteriales bacterium]|nr:MAG: hypothetical protein IPM56_02270 [Ignavibacteriales bacterium]